jgi:hypothetical protein
VNAHARKSDGKYRDSSAIGANVDQILEMELDKDEPTIRGFAPKGRWLIPPFRIRFDGSEYHLVTGDISHETKVLFHIQSDPGCSKRAIRDEVGGRATDTDAAIDRLIRAEAIENRGGRSKGEYWPKRVPNRVPSDGTRSTPDTVGGACSSHTVAGQSADRLEGHTSDRVPMTSVSLLQTRRVETDTLTPDTYELEERTALQAESEAA